MHIILLQENQKGMSYVHRMYHCPYYANFQAVNPSNVYNPYGMSYYPYCLNKPMYNSGFQGQFRHRHNPYSAQINNPVIELKDYGPDPFVVDIEKATKQNNTFRTALWTGKYFQLTLMSIGAGEDIGLEMHPDVDQFIRIEEGQGLVLMGDSMHDLNYQRRVYDDYIIIIPAGKWHNVINVGNKPIKLYSIYAPPQHPHGTVHETKEMAEAAEVNH